MEMRLRCLANDFFSIVRKKQAENETN